MARRLRYLMFYFAFTTIRNSFISFDMETLSEKQWVKVSKSKILFFLKVQKSNGILDEILPYKTRSELCQILSKYCWAMEFKEKKNALEIY